MAVERQPVSDRIARPVDLGRRVWHRSWRLQARRTGLAAPTAELDCSDDCAAGSFAGQSGEGQAGELRTNFRRRQTAEYGVDIFRYEPDSARCARVLLC